MRMADLPFRRPGSGRKIVTQQLRELEAGRGR